MFKDKDRIPRRVEFKWIEGDPASVDAMRKAGLEDAQALIIGGSTSAAPKEADAYTLTTITLAQARRSSFRSPGCLTRQTHAREQIAQGFYIVSSSVSHI